MGQQDRLTAEFKQDAAAPVGERLGISTKSPYRWKALFSKPVTVRSSEADLAAQAKAPGADPFRPGPDHKQLR